MNFRIIYSFTTFAKQLIQDTERYHFLNYQKTKNKLYEEQFITHRDHYFKTLTDCSLDQVPNWKMLVENIFRIEQEPKETLIQLINKYRDNFGESELSKIKNDKLSHLIINPDNIYQYQKIGSNIEDLKKKYEEYELSLTVYREVELNLLLKHLINCQKIELQIFPVHTINLIHHNIELCPDASFLTDLVKYLRSKRSQTYKLPNETWFMIFDKLQQLPLNEYDIQFACQLIQQFAHQRIQIKYNITKLIEKIVKQFKPAVFKQYTLLEILRTINILRANRYSVADIQELIKLCNNQKSLKGEKEYDIFMNLEHAAPNIQLVEQEDFNTYLTEILLSDTKKLNEIEQKSLRDKIFNQLQTEVDQNSLKKIIVLSRQLWPNEISLVQKCAKQIRSKLATNDQSKEMISLAINALYEFKRVQYPFLDEQLLTYLASVEELYINPQEISVLLYYICQSLPKMTRKELFNVKTRDYPINKVISKIFISIIPVIQKMCQKNALRLKVLFTLTDCICKYRDELKNIDLKFLFEKVEFNIVYELEIKKQCRVSLELKDILFLKERFLYLKVGSRKLLKFFDDSQGNYFKAVNYLLKRQRVYLQMRQRRGQAMRAKNSFQ